MALIRGSYGRNGWAQLLGSMKGFEENKNNRVEYGRKAMKRLLVKAMVKLCLLRVNGCGIECRCTFASLVLENDCTDLQPVTGRYIPIACNGLNVTTNLKQVRNVPSRLSSRGCTQL